MSGTSTVVLVGGFKNTPGVRRPWELTEVQWAQIRAAAPGATFIHSKDLGAPDSRIEEAEVAAGSVPPHALPRAGRLRWLQSWKAGPNDMMYPEMVASPVVLTCCAGNGSIPLAEHALMLMLMLDRGMRQAFEDQNARHWERRRHGELNGRTCGIIGLGNAGSDLALKCKAMHMTVLGLVRRRRDEAVPHVDELFLQDQLHAFLGRCDFVVVTAPLTPDTRNMIDRAALDAMKPAARLINISRGGIIDDDAMLAALHDGRLAGAGLDAQTQEPLPEDSPFWSAPNVILTPHVGATTVETVQRGVDIFADNLRRYLAGRPLTNVVDKTAGY